MISYILRRLLLIFPTLLGIMLLNFFIIQAAPGGPVEQMIARLQNQDTSAVSRLSGEDQAETPQSENRIYRGAQGLDPEMLQSLEKLFGFDKPVWERFVLMVKNYVCLDFGESFFKNKKVIDLILEKLPVSASLGIWSTLLVYLVSIPLGIRKAVRHGSPFDIWTSTLIIMGNAIPVFLFAIVLIVFFAGGSYLQWFPLRGLTSANFAELSLVQKILDYFWHMALPITAMVIGGFASLTMLTKNSFLDEMNKQYTLTAKAKGLSEKRVLYGHVFRNAMLIIVAGFPGAFLHMFFAGSVLIEVIFSLDGLGLLGFESTINRDYPVMFATLYIFTLLGMLTKIISDVCYTLVDPRIHFEGQT